MLDGARGEVVPLVGEPSRRNLDDMADPLKTFFSPQLVRRLAADMARVHADFAHKEFIRRASRGLDELELLDRGKHISRVLAQYLPQDYPSALEILLRSLGPEHATDELVGVGMAPFYYLPHTLFVAERGLEHFELSLHAQYELTKRFTAESSIRAYLSREPERTMAQLTKWARDPNAHVRRLVSEGTRLRLPWASRVPWLDAHPERVLTLIEPLHRDPTTLVRRSVANNLNDLSKTHPALVLDTCQRWLAGESPETTALVKHALRTLIKKGDRAALGLLGAGERPRVKIDHVQLSAKAVRLGGELRFSFRITSAARQTQRLLVDYVVHFQKQSGATKPKVFKLKRVDLLPRASCELSGKISFADLTTRRHYPGKHHLGVLINGVGFPLADFQVKART